MFSKKLFVSFYLLIVFSANLFAQDISSGVRLIRSEKLSEAKNYFMSLLGSKVNSEACFYLGEIFFQQQNLDSAKLFYDKGIESNKKFFKMKARIINTIMAMTERIICHLNSSRCSRNDISPSPPLADFHFKAIFGQFLKFSL